MATVFRQTLIANPQLFYQRPRSVGLFGFVAGFTAATLATFNTTNLPHNLSQDKPWQKATVIRSVAGSPRVLLSTPPVAAPFSQKDWPNPVLRVQARQADSSGFDTAILTYAVGLNTPNQRQVDWPNPVLKVYRQQDLTTWTQNLLQTTLAPVVARPFSQEEWPVPRGAKANQALGFVSGAYLSSPPAVVPGNQYQWPNPAGPRRSGDLGQVGSGLSLTAIDTATLPHALIHDASWQRATSFTSVYGSTRLLTGAAVVAAPFFETDWPNPVRALPRQFDQTTWTQNLLQTTLGPPFKQTDWQNPRGALQARQADSSGFDTPILVYADGLNTANNPKPDWPNPRGPVPRSVDALTWTQSLAAQYVAASVKPFLQTEWPLPVPRIYRQIAESRGFEQPILNYAVGLNTAAKPQFDWPNPRGPQRSSDALTWTQSLVAQYTSLAVKPFLQTDWPLSVPRVYRQIAETRGFGQPILGYAVGLNDANKRKTDWPNPRGPARASDLATWTQEGLARSTAAAIGRPFVQNDWPLSVPPKPPLNVGYAQGLSEPVRVAHVPFNNLRNYEWPVPKGPPPLHLGYASGFAEPVRIAHVPFAHLRNFNWPVPRGPARSIDALTWKIYLQQYQLPPQFVIGGPADESERVACVPSSSRTAVEPALLRTAMVPAEDRTAAVPELLRVVDVPDTTRIVMSNDFRDRPCHDT